MHVSGASDLASWQTLTPWSRGCGAALLHLLHPLATLIRTLTGEGRTYPLVIRGLQSGHDPVFLVFARTWLSRGICGVLGAQLFGHAETSSERFHKFIAAAVLAHPSLVGLGLGTAPRRKQRHNSNYPCLRQFLHGDEHIIRLVGLRLRLFSREATPARGIASGADTARCLPPSEATPTSADHRQPYSSYARTSLGLVNTAATSYSYLLL